MKHTKCPERLRTLLDNGVAWIEDGEYLVISSVDRETVSLGNVGKEKQVERYLEYNPDPSDW